MIYPLLNVKLDDRLACVGQCAESAPVELDGGQARVGSARVGECAGSALVELDEGQTRVGPARVGKCAG